MELTTLAVPGAERAELLRRLQALQAEVSAQALLAFANAYERRSYRKGDIITAAGRPAQEVFFIQRGCVRLFYYRDGEEVTAAFSFEGAFAGPCKSMMLQCENRQVFQAFEDCELYMLSRQSYFRVLEAVPELYKAKSIIAERIMFEQEDIISFFLSYTPQERYLTLLQQQPQLFQRVPLVHIASLIGVSAVSLSRIRRRVAS